MVLQDWNPRRPGGQEARSGRWWGIAVDLSLRSISTRIGAGDIARPYHAYGKAPRCYPIPHPPTLDTFLQVPEGEGEGEGERRTPTQATPLTACAPRLTQLV